MSRNYPGRESKIAKSTHGGQENSLANPECSRATRKTGEVTASNGAYTRIKTKYSATQPSGARYGKGSRQNRDDAQLQQLAGMQHFQGETTGVHRWWPG